MKRFGACATFGIVILLFGSGISSLHAENRRDRGRDLAIDLHEFPIWHDLFRATTSTSTSTDIDEDRVRRRNRSDEQSQATTTPREGTGGPTQSTAPVATSTPLTTNSEDAVYQSQTRKINNVPEKITPSPVVHSVVRILNFLDLVPPASNEYDYAHLHPNTTRVLYGTSLALVGIGGLSAIPRRGRKKWLTYLVMCTGILIASIVAYINNETRQIPVEFSPKVTLSTLWGAYKENYLEASTGRTLDPSRDAITTSEGESYTMLRAVWEGDKETFDRSWKWTKDNLRRKTDPGISWLFGKNATGYGVVTAQGGINSASDADTDIALALIFAYARWREPLYQGDAYVMLTQIWEHDVVTIKGKPYLTASDSEKKGTNPVAINPSYFSPASYRIFAAFDDKHDWKALIDTSYDVLHRTTDMVLDVKESAKLPPDWVVMDRATGEIHRGPDPKMRTTYGFDAFRVPWRIALDWQWHKEPRAKEYLQKLSFLEEEWRERGMLYAVYGHDGSPVLKIESPAAYGANMGYFVVVRPNEAKKIYEHKLQYLYNPDTRSWKEKLSYYDDNWAWFGMALYNKLLPNLYATQGS